jgi:hypothetical protein
MAGESPEQVPDLRPRPRRPRAVYMVAVAYVCAVGFFVGGGPHQWGAFFILPGFWLWLIGGIWSMSDMSFSERHRSGVIALLAAVALPFGFWWTLVALTSPSHLQAV